LKAAQIVAPQTIELVEAPRPDPQEAGPDHVLVRVELGTLCGSDLPFFQREFPSYPLPPGLSLHECVGTVVASTSPRFREGDRVLAFPLKQWGLGEYFLASAHATAPLPEFEPLEVILLAQPLGTIIWAFRKLGNLLHAHTVVLGQGPMGLLLDHFLSNLGAKTVIGLDLLDYRLEIAREKMRATHTVNVTREDPVEAVRELTGGEMADLVVEAVGHNLETLNTCIDLVRPGGTILAFGVPDEEIYPLRFKELFYRNLTLVCSVTPEAAKDYPLAMDMIMQGRIEVRPLLTHRLPWTQAQRAFEMFLHKQDGVLKVVLDFAAG